MKLQPASEEIWKIKYQLKDDKGDNIDQDIDGTFDRVATALANVEETDKEKWYKEFKWVMQNGAIPAGRIMSNAGAEGYKPATSTINCTVSGTIEDSMDDILDKVHEAGLTLRAGCGIGYSFSTLRHKGAYVKGAGAYTSGPISFMDIYDKMCFTISSAGGRRGAMMATFDVSHPDVMDFIRAKREDGKLRQFNLSLLITKEFIEAVKEEAIWDFLAVDTKEVVSSIPAKELWDTIMSSTYDFAEPGFILIDEVNSMNNNWWCEDIRATNPCLCGDSLVETLGGWVKLKDITEPTIVYTMLEDGSLGTSKASASWVSKKDAPTLKITAFFGKELICTPDHRIYLRDRGWVEARDLKTGDNLMRLGLPDANVVKIEPGPTIDVYDMSVEVTHNYIANSLIVHNCGELLAA